MASQSVFSFFSGLGFLDLGFEMAGFSIDRINEFNPAFLEAYTYSREKLGLMIPKDSIEAESIESLVAGKGLIKIKQAMEAARKNGGMCGFIGGPPCPDFSVGGKNRGKTGDHGKLTGTYFDLITKAMPDWFLFENVKGLWRTKRHKKFYDQMVNKAEKAGYTVRDRLSNSLHYGAAQYRERIIMVGFREEHGKRIEEEDWMRHLKYKNEEIQKIPWPPAQKFGTKASKPPGVPSELTVLYWLKKNSVQRHPNMRMAFQPRAGLKRFLTVDEGDDSRKSYKRLHRYRYSPTACYGNNEVHLHPTEARRISVAEALAIQTAPKEFVLPQTMTLSAAFKAIGNGVPVLMAERLARMIREKIDE